jgi:hypothetical protein
VSLRLSNLSDETSFNFWNNVESPFKFAIWLQEALPSTRRAFPDLLHDLRANNTIASYNLACAIADGARLQIGFLQGHDIVRYCVGSILLLRIYAYCSLYLTWFKTIRIDTLTYSTQLLGEDLHNKKIENN